MALLNVQSSKGYIRSISTTGAREQVSSIENRTNVATTLATDSVSSTVEGN